MIVFVRHGETDANKAGLLLGRSDPPLNATGEEQARAAADALAGSDIAAIVSSPLQRAEITAAAIADRAGLPVEIEQRLIEIDYGDWDEEPFGGLAPDIVIKWRSDPTFAPPGGESLAALQARVEECAADLLDRSRDGMVVAVSHVSPIKAAVCFALGVDERASWRMFLGLASITSVGARDDGTPYLASFNETAHLLKA